MATAKPSVADILASAFSQMLDTPVLTYEEFQRKKESAETQFFSPLDVDTIFRLSYQMGTDETSSIDAQETANHCSRGITIFVKDANGQTLTVTVDKRDKTQRLKETLSARTGLSCSEMRLIFGGKQLKDDVALHTYGIDQGGHTIFMLLKIKGGNGEMRIESKYIDESVTDPHFDYDFTFIDDGSTKYYRGGKRYYRPCGWRRAAIKVKGKFEDDKWLGAPGDRRESTEGEWPVAYHGTGIHCSGAIAREGLKLNKGIRFKHGHGIYTTPSIELAAKYAKPFDIKGVPFKLVFQTRICPQGMKVISASMTGEGAEHWIQPDENLVRHYGFCVKACEVGVVDERTGSCTIF